jgi:GAF domain-containing protein
MAYPDSELEALAAGVSGLRGLDYIQDAVIGIAKVLSAEYVFVGEWRREDNAVQTTAVSAFFAPGDNFQYCLDDTPCANVFDQGVCSYPSRVAERFPKDQLLTDMKIEAYLGVPIADSTGRTRGILVALYCRPMPQPDRTRAVFEFMSARIGRELEIVAA